MSSKRTQFHCPSSPYPDDCFIPSNYKGIMAKIIALPVERGCIRYNTAVTSVVADSTPPQRVFVTTSDGQQMRFDDVVFTAPLGYLKLHKETIQPMDARLSRAIDSISYGRLEKVSMLHHEISFLIPDRF